MRREAVRDGKAPASLSTPTHPAAVPLLVVFDLDDTIWWPELYMMSGAPFKKDKKQSGRVYDVANEEISVYPAASVAMHLISTHHTFVNAKTKIAVASRTHRRQWAKECIKLLELEAHISYTEIYAGSKQLHFEKLRTASGVPFADMLFFDNEKGNVTDVRQLGVTCVYCPGGMSEQAWEEGIVRFAASKTMDA